MKAIGKVISVNPKAPLELPPCNIVGVRALQLTAKEDPVSAELAKVDLEKNVELVSYEHWAKGDSIREHLDAMVQMRAIPLNPRHAEFLFRNPESFPDSWKGTVYARKYIGFAGAVVYPTGSSEPMVVMLWWDGYAVRRSYSSQAAENRQSKFYFAMFKGNPFSAK